MNCLLAGQHKGRINGAHFAPVWFRITSFVVLWTLCGAEKALAQTDHAADKVEPPVANQPQEFSGALGSYAVTTQAEPTTLQAEDTIRFKVKVKVVGAGSIGQIKRPNLQRLRQFARQFAIKNGADRDLPDEKAREFAYELRPRNTGVKQIPALPFVYFNPRIRPATQGYQWAYAPAIPIVVKPRTAVAPSEVQTTFPVKDLPESVYQYTTGSNVLLRQEPFTWPGPILLSILALGPPALCAVWLALWQRAYPDAARVARQRRSRAARQALAALQAVGKREPEEQAQQAKEIVVAYLQERLDFHVLEPTPEEVTAHLRQSGSAPEIVGEAGRFFAACDAARFADLRQPLPGSSSAAAADLVRHLEDQSWATFAA
jgi:hypothetical protein